MAINGPSSDPASLRIQTAAAANEAHAAGLLTEDGLRRLTDGTVSNTDLLQSKVLIRHLEAGEREAQENIFLTQHLDHIRELQGLAKELKNAIETQVDAQGFFATEWEGLKDFFGIKSKT